MSEPRRVDIELASHAVKESRPETLRTLSWFYHHAGQIAKGSAALVGLALLGGVGFLARGVFSGWGKTDAAAPAAEKAVTGGQDLATSGEKLAAESGSVIARSGDRASADSAGTAESGKDQEPFQSESGIVIAEGEIDFGESFSAESPVARSVWPETISLSSLNGMNGFALDGENSGDRSGVSVNYAGDINGDGIADLIVGAHGYPAGGISGRSYVVFGSRNPWSATLALASLNGTNGFKIDGENSHGYSGGSVSYAGDINGDGMADLIVGAWGYPTGGCRGRSYVIFGSRNPWSATLALASLNGTNGFKIDGENSDDYSGSSVSYAGDVNGDGIADLIVGAYGYASHQGRSYVIFGSTNPWNATLALASLNGINGFKIDGENSQDRSGESVSYAGDINGDGIADLIVGADGYPEGGNRGRSYVIFGSRNPWSATLALASLNGTNGFKIDGENGDGSGISVSYAGDINGDGMADLIIGASYYPANVEPKGRSYVVFGSRNPWNATLALAGLNGTNGFKIDGENSHDYSGRSVSYAGDINGDGMADLIVGAVGYPSGGVGSIKGRSYVIFGCRQPWNATLSLASLNGSNGFKIDGENGNDYSGNSISYAGDINGDGMADLIVGAGNYPAGGVRGRSYVIFGAHPLLLWTNQLTLHRCDTVIFDSTLLNITKTVQNDPTLLLNISGLAHGRFESIAFPGSPINSFNQSQITNQQIQFVHDCTSSIPAYSVQVSAEGQFPYVPPTLANITFYPDLPVLTVASFHLDEQGIANITASILSAYDPVARFTDDQLTFIPVNLQFGRFSLSSNPAFALQNFTQAQVKNESIIFVQDGSRFKPEFNITVSDGFASSLSLAGQINFTFMPHLVHNQLAVDEGYSTVLTSNDLSAIDPSYDTNQLIFYPSSVQQGRFEYTNGTVVSSFYQWQVLNQMIQFTHTGGSAAPSYYLSVSDGRLSEEPLLADITFYHLPQLLRNQLEIGQGKTVVLSSSNLMATDQEISAASLLFIISGLTNGHFENVAAPGQAITNFTQGILSYIQFVHDGTASAPSYAVSVNNGRVTIPSSSAAITFTFTQAPIVNLALQGQSYCCSAYPGKIYHFSFASNTFISPSGNQLTYTAAQEDGTSLPDWLTFNATTSNFRGIAQNATNYRITVVAIDPSITAQVSNTFTLRVEGAPQLQLSLTPQMAAVGKSFYTFIKQGSFIDPNGDVISYDSGLASGDPLPTFLLFNPNSATYWGTPMTRDKNVYLVTVLASDRIVYPPTQANFTLVVQDSVADQTAVADRFFTSHNRFTIPSDTVFAGRPLKYGTKMADGTSFPSWLSYDALTRVLSGTPNVTDISSTPILLALTLNDGQGEASLLFNLQVIANSPPALKSMIPAQSAQGGIAYQFAFASDVFEDPNGDSLSYRADLGDASSWLKFNPLLRSFTGTPSGWNDAYPYLTRTYVIGITAVDPSGSSATGTFTLNLKGSSWEVLINTSLIILGALITTYGYTKKKHLMWDFFKKDEYRKPLELLTVGDKEFSHKISIPAEDIKSIVVTLSDDRSSAQRTSRCLRKTFGFFSWATTDIKERVFPCASVYLFPWLFYDSKTNTLRSVEGGPTAKFVDKDIKIQVRGTDNRLMEEFHIKIDSYQVGSRPVLERVSSPVHSDTTMTFGGKSSLGTKLSGEIEMKERKRPQEFRA